MMHYMYDAKGRTSRTCAGPVPSLAQPLSPSAVEAAGCCWLLPQIVCKQAGSGKAKARNSTPSIDGQLGAAGGHRSMSLMSLLPFGGGDRRRLFVFVMMMAMSSYSTG